MNRFFILSVSLGLGMLQAACGSSKTTATSTPSASCVPISDAKLAESYPAQAIDPNITSLYSQLQPNAEATFVAVTNSIVQGALAASPNDLGTSFIDKLSTAGMARQTEFTTHLKDFLASAFGGPAYTGPDMVESHSGLNITIAQYNAFLNLVVVPALKANNVSSETIGKMAPVVQQAAFVKTVVSCE